ncbi:anti-sigma factor domain-containing protein, partial [Gemmatimonas sp.]|uniref:anti-sigma factor domain-containing protein n=1 Tax=Gemmatimonas sp. TaxID=1962908 RepID=UPI00356234C6
LAASLVVAVDFRNRTAALEERAAQDDARIARTEAKLAEREKTLQTLLAGRGNVVLVNLNPAQPTGPGRQVFWNVREGKAVVNAYGLAPVASDRAYILWMIRDGKPVPLKLFTPDDDGRAIVASVELPTTTSGITLLAVTEESSAGAIAPTMTPFLVGEVPAKGATR